MQTSQSEALSMLRAHACMTQSFPDSSLKNKGSCLLLIGHCASGLLACLSQTNTHLIQMPAPLALLLNDASEPLASSLSLPVCALACCSNLQLQSANHACLTSSAASLQGHSAQKPADALHHMHCLCRIRPHYPSARPRPGRPSHHTLASQGSRGISSGGLGPPRNSTGHNGPLGPGATSLVSRPSGPLVEPTDSLPVINPAAATEKDDRFLQLPTATSDMKHKVCWSGDPLMRWDDQEQLHELEA